MPASETGAPDAAKPLETWLAEIDAASAHGERLQAFDIAEAALIQFPDALAVKHALVLALARAGATQQARARYRQFGLDTPFGPDILPRLRLDIAALEARITKDVAMADFGVDRADGLRNAAARYEAIFAATGDYYPGINAATLCYAGGNVGRAQLLARSVLAACRSAHDAVGAAYFRHATEAEAHLLLGDLDAAVAALEAASRHAGNLSDAATTRKQLAVVCAVTATGPNILQALRLPAIIHFTGHNIGARFTGDPDGDVARRIAGLLDRYGVGIGFGSLAGGSDILVAEALLLRGGELNVVLPFGVDEFRRVSVEPSGADWLPRFDRCFAGARSVSFATTDAFLGDTSLFAYSSHLAMGLALLRASYLGVAARQLAVWDGDASKPESFGTGADIAYWTARGGHSDIVAPAFGAGVCAQTPAPESQPSDRPDRHQRVIRAILFGDIKGFGTLGEAQLPVFVQEVLGRFAAVLDRYRDRIPYRNSWGDGLFVVALDVETAARCALDLQAAMDTLDPARHGFPATMGLRLGAHCGPVFQLHDPVLRHATFFGVHVSRAARIEPVVPTGAVYVTEAFAANLATLPCSPFVCEYVGQVPAAKNYGTMRMYSLRRRPGFEPLTASL